MKKAKKKKLYVITSVVLVLLTFIIIFSYSMGTRETSFGGEVAVYLDCDSAIQKYTHGANIGECFVYVLNNQETLYYVKNIVEKTNSRGETSCQIESSGSSSLIYTCDVAYKKDGSTVQICKNDLECPSQNCVNWMCKAGEPRTCNVFNSTKCISDTEYETCLKSGMWSGILHCRSDEKCVNSKCQKPICTVGEEKCLNGIGFECIDDGWTWQQIEKPECVVEDTGSGDTKDSPEEDSCPGDKIQCSDGSCLDSCTQTGASLQSSLIAGSIGAGIVAIIILIVWLVRKKMLLRSFK